jgi:acetyl esterase/lipase
MTAPYWRSWLFGAALLAAAPAWAAPAWAAPARAVLATPAVADVAYGSVPQQVLDLYQPVTPGAHRLVVFVHGGAWMHGDKNVGSLIARGLLPAGYAVASVEYRRVPAVGPADEAIDAAHAIAFLRLHAAAYRLDPGRFAIIGHSSGGHIVALLATDAHYLRDAGVDPASLAAVVTLDGIFDIATDIAHNGRRDHLSAIFGDDPRGWNAVSPVALAGTLRTHPEFCILHEDTTPRFVEQAQLFESALRRAGQSVETATAPGISHGKLVEAFPSPALPMTRFSLSCLAHAFAAPYTSNRP